MPPIPVSGFLPNDYQEVLAWRVTGKPARMLSIQIMAAISLVIFGFVFFRLAVSLGKLPAQMTFGLGEIGAVLLGILLAMGLHELTHGLVMQMLGAKPKYGILWKEMMLYATSLGMLTLEPAISSSPLRHSFSSARSSLLARGYCREHYGYPY